MSPASGQQGGTLTVSLTGDTTYLTHFANGQSVASFGSGITVNSLTVTDATHATASIAIDPSAAVGPRAASIVTGTETAVSVNAFNVLTGVNTVSGKLADAGSSQAISGATVLIQGTTFTATTDANGAFTLKGVPAGAQTLIANANNYALATVPIALKAGTPLDLGTIKLNPTVFDPTAAPQVSLAEPAGKAHRHGDRRNLGGRRTQRHRGHDHAGWRHGDGRSGRLWKSAEPQSRWTWAS